MNAKYLIIGNSAAGIGAVEGIRKNDKKGKIIVLTREKHPSYSRPFIVNYAGQNTPLDRIYFNNPGYLEDLKAEVLYEKEVEKVLAAKYTVKLKGGEEIRYEKLLIASGGNPIRPPIKGDDMKQVIGFMTLDDALKMKEYSAGTDTAVVLGGGLIGLKAAEALVEMKKQVVMVELADFILSRVMDGKAASLMTERLEKCGVTVKTANTVEEIQGRLGNVSGVRLKDGTKVKCGLVVIAIGVTPNLDFIDKSEFKVNRGLVVDRYLKTTVSDVYGAGDAAEADDLVTGDKAVIAIWPVAKKQGYYAGLNMSGEKKEYAGGLVENILQFEGLSIISYGLISPPAGAQGYEVLARDSGSRDYLKLILKKNTLVGAIIANNLALPGVYRDLIINKTDISSVRADLLKDDFGWKYFPKELRDEKFLRIK